MSNPYTYKPRPFDSATITVLLEHGIRFSFEVQDWDLEEDKALTHDEAHGMAGGLVKDGVLLHGKLAGPDLPLHDASIEIDPTRIVTFYITPTGRNS